MQTGDRMRGSLIVLLTLLSYDLCLCPAFSQSVSWTRTDTLLSDKVAAIAVDDSSKVFVSAGWAIYSSTNLGDNWALVMNTSLPTCLLFGPDSILYASTVGGNVMLSTDRGLSWQFPAAFCIYPLGAIVLDLQGRLLAGAQGGSQNFPGGLYRSGAHACCWGHVHISFPWEPTINAILVTHDSTILVNGYRSTDDGENWTPGIAYTTKCFALRPDNSIVAGGDLGIYLSSDDGATWTFAVPDLPSVSVNCLVQNRRGRLFAGTITGGVYASNDGGLNWNPINDGLTQLNVYALAIDSAGYLYAGTDVGVFRSIQSTTSTDYDRNPGPSNFSLSQNYPNPFNPVTNIQFSIVNRQLTIVKVFDILGREVATMVNEVKQPGTYTVQFDGSNLASGVYFYRIQAGSFVQTRKLLLLK